MIENYKIHQKCQNLLQIGIKLTQFESFWVKKTVSKMLIKIQHVLIHFVATIQICTTNFDQKVEKMMIQLQFKSKF